MKIEKIGALSTTALMVSLGLSVPFQSPVAAIAATEQTSQKANLIITPNKEHLQSPPEARDLVQVAQGRKADRNQRKIRQQNNQREIRPKNQEVRWQNNQRKVQQQNHQRGTQQIQRQRQVQRRNQQNQQREAQQNREIRQPSQWQEAQQRWNNPNNRPNNQLERQREAWQQRLNREREARRRQDRMINQRLRNLNERQRRVYWNYVNYRDHDYWRDRDWLHRNYGRDRAFWSGPGYWYDRDYWRGRGYVWDDVITGVMGGFLGRGGVYSSTYPYTYGYPRSAVVFYANAPRILSYNNLAQTACEPGTVVILLPNQRVMCAYPTDNFVPGTYQVNTGNYAFVPARVVY